MALRNLFCAMLMLGGATLAWAEETYRTWTDREGRTMKARFVELRLPNVYLQRDDGRYFEYPLEELSDADKRFVEFKLAEKYATQPKEKWTMIKLEKTTDDGIKVNIIGRYRESGKYLVIELTQVVYDVPSSQTEYTGAFVRGVKPRIVEVDPEETHWKRWRSFGARDSDGEVEFKRPAPKGPPGYARDEAILEMKEFRCFIPNWARKSERVLLGIEARIGSNYELMVPIGPIQFEIAPVEE